MKEFSIQLGGVWYIDPVRLLHFLKERASIISERIAVPGTDHQQLRLYVAGLVNY